MGVKKILINKPEQPNFSASFERSAQSCQIRSDIFNIFFSSTIDTFPSERGHNPRGSAKRYFRYYESGQLQKIFHRHHRHLSRRFKPHASIGACTLHPLPRNLQSGPLLPPPPPPNPFLWASVVLPGSARRKKQRGKLVQWVKETCKLAPSSRLRDLALFRQHQQTQVETPHFIHKEHRKRRRTLNQHPLTARPIAPAVTA